MYRESPKPMKTFLAHLAKHAGQEFTAAEMAKAIERTRNQLAGVLGAFGRRCKNRYRWTKWPFFAYWDSDRKALVYRMTPEVAAFIHRHRGRSERERSPFVFLRPFPGPPPLCGHLRWSHCLEAEPVGRT